MFLSTLKPSAEGSVSKTCTILQREEAATAEFTHWPCSPLRRGRGSAPRNRTAGLSSAARAKRMVWDGLVTAHLCPTAPTAQALLPALAQPCPAGISEAASRSAGRPAPFTCSNEEGTSSGSLKFFASFLAKLSACHLFRSSSPGASASYFSCLHPLRSLCSLYFICSITADACWSRFSPRQARQHVLSLSAHASPPTTSPRSQDVTIQRRCSPRPPKYRIQANAQIQEK